MKNVGATHIQHTVVSCSPALKIYYQDVINLCKIQQTAASSSTDLLSCTTAPSQLPLRQITCY